MMNLFWSWAPCFLKLMLSGKRYGFLIENVALLCILCLHITCRIPFTIWMQARLQGFIIARTLRLVFVFVCCLLVAPLKQRLLPRVSEFRDGELVWESSLVRFLKNCCREGTGSWVRMLLECVLCRSDCERFTKKVTDDLFETVLRKCWLWSLPLPRTLVTTAWLATDVYSWCPFRFSALHSVSDSIHNLNFSTAVRGASYLLLFLSSASLPEVTVEVKGVSGWWTWLGIGLALFEMLAIRKARVLDWQCVLCRGDCERILNEEVSDDLFETVLRNRCREGVFSIVVLNERIAWHVLSWSDWYVIVLWLVSKDFRKAILCGMFCFGLI